jgi:DNA-binding beta-propeller fold protein YncE
VKYLLSSSGKGCAILHKRQSLANALRHRAGVREIMSRRQQRVPSFKSTSRSTTTREFKMPIFLLAYVATVVVAIFSMNTALVQAGPPPFPNELAYPNIVKPKHQFGTYGDKIGEFSDPRSVAFIGKNTILISDSGNRRVQQFTVDGANAKLWGEVKWGRPAGISVDKTRVAVADTSEGCIWVLNHDGNLLSRIGTFGAGSKQLQSPNDVAFQGNKLIEAVSKPPEADEDAG